jgi:O-antigen/teichoic acid export membrane protein
VKLGQTSFVHFLSRIGVSVVGFAATVYLARELGAEVLGTYYLSISLLYWLVVLGDFGITGSLRKRLSEADSRPGVLTAGLVSQSGLFALITVGLLITAPVINNYLGAEVAHWLVALLAAKLGLDFVSVVLDGQHKVHISSLLSPVDRAVQSAVQITLTLVGVGLVGLFVGYLAGAITAIVFGLYFARTRLRIPTRTDFYSLYTFARYSWLGTLKGRAFLSMDTIILGYFIASNSVVGIYEVAWNLSSIFAIFSGSLNRALFPEISSLGADQTARIRDLTSAAVAYAGLFLIPGLVGAVLVGETILSIYGSEFTAGATILAVLILSQLVYAYEEQFITILGAMDHPDVIFRVNAVFLTVNLGLNVLLVPRIGWVGAAIGTTASAAAGLILSYRGLSRYLNFEIPWGELVRQVVSAAIMAIVVLAGTTLLGKSLTTVVPLVFVGAAVYAVLLITLSEQFRTLVVDNLPFEVPLLS